MRSRMVSLLAFILVCVWLGVGASDVGAQNRTTLNFVFAGAEGRFSNVTEAFEKENPTVRIEATYLPFEETHAQYTILARANRLPDGGEIFDNMVAEFSPLLEVSDEYLYPWQIDLMFPLVYRGAEYRGKHYGVPMFLYTHTLFYRSDLTARLGLSVPRTWDELTNAARKMSNPPNIYGFGLVGGGGRAKHVMYYFSDMLWSFGADYFDKKGQTAFDSPEGIAALTYVSDLINKYRATQPGVTEYNEGTVYDTFAAGKLGLMIMYSGAGRRLELEKPDLQWGIDLVPKGKIMVNLGSIDAFVVFKSSKNKDMTEKFARFILRDDIRLKMVQELKWFAPISKSIATLYPFYQNTIGKVESETMEYLKMRPAIPEWEEVQEAMATEIQKAYVGRISPTEALRNAARQVRRIVK